MNAPLPTMEPAMALALAATFGSVESWREQFLACARAPHDAAPWMLLSFVASEGTLVHQRVPDPAGAPQGAVPVLALDLRGLRGQTMPLDAFVAAIDWAAVYQRYQHAVHEASEPWAAAQDELGAALVLDVRRAGVFDKSPSMIPGARWRDPAAVGQWAAELPAGRDIVVYCVYGHEVGRATALRLRAAGHRARYLSGGIDGWQAAGRALVAKGQSS